MKRLIKAFHFKIDDIDDSGVFSGYASTFGDVDLGFDIVEKGAFKKTLQESQGKVPILDHHDPSKQIGWNLEAREDERGLLVRGQLDLNVAGARERHSLMRTALEIGARTGLSIGYRVIKEETDKKNPLIRLLKEVQLLEYSVVTFPMNPQASVTNVKAQQELFENFLRNDMDMDDAQVKKAIVLLEQIKNPEPDPHSEIKKLEPLSHSLNDLLETIKS